MDFENGTVTIAVANNFAEESLSVFNKELLLENLQKALEIAERRMVVDYTTVKIETKVDEKSGYRILLTLTVSGLLFEDVSEDEEEVPIYDVEWTEFPIEMQEKISESIIIMMINSWLEEEGLDPVDIDTIDDEITLEQKQCIIRGIVEHYTDERAPDLTDKETDEILKNFGFNFNHKGETDE